MNDFWFGFKKGFRRVGDNIVMIVNTVLLTLVYFLGVGPSWLITKLTGKKLLDTKKKDSYWNELNLGKEELEKYHRQF